MAENMRTRRTAVPAAVAAVGLLLGSGAGGARGEEPPAGQSNLLQLAADAPAMGSPAAPIVMVELVDFRCPFCADQAAAALDEVVRRYVEPGIVRYVAIDLPLPRHPEAERDAMAARCAGEQDGYWRAHRLLLTERRQLGAGPLDLDALAAGAGLDPARLAACFAAGRHLEAVRADARLAAGVAADATPTFLFGFPDGDAGAIRVERHVEGAVGLEPVVAAIEALRESLRQRALRQRVDQ